MTNRKDPSTDLRLKKYSENLSRNDINKYIEYNCETGLLKWIDHYHPVHKSILTGKQAGSLCKKGYLEVTFLNKKIRCHNIAWYLYYGKWPDNFLDHINRVKTDNRIENLRDVTHYENMQNIEYKKSGVTGYFGVRVNKILFKPKIKKSKSKLYNAFYKNKNLGRYQSAVDAAYNRDKYIVQNKIKRPLNFPQLLNEYLCD